MKTDFHNKDFALSLALKWRLAEMTGKWPIARSFHMCLLLPFSSFTPDEWEGYSAENIAKAERERKASIALRSEINGILMQSYVDLRNIFEVVNNEFSKRIEESVSAKRSLEKELARVSLDNNSVHRI